MHLVEGLATLFVQPRQEGQNESLHGGTESLLHRKVVRLVDRDE